MSTAPTGGLRLDVEHVTTYTYSEPVSSSFNEARLSPSDGDGQTVLASEVATEPATTVRTHRDYWGNTVSTFGVDGPHRDLVVTGSASVLTAPGTGPGPDPAGWDVVRGGDALDELAELLAPTPMTAPDDRLRDIGRRAAGAGDPVAAVRTSLAAVRGLLEYRPGSTGVATCAARAAADGAGVCQDFAHVGLAVLRAAGIPARYCSGYLVPHDDPEADRPLAGESHAWVEVWTGRWWGLDPTNDLDVGPRHVLVARGRDYADVAPLRGVYCGDGVQSMRVAVTLTRRAG